MMISRKPKMSEMILNIILLPLRVRYDDNQNYLQVHFADFKNDFPILDTTLAKIYLSKYIFSSKKIFKLDHIEVQAWMHN